MPFILKPLMPYPFECEILAEDISCFAPCKRIHKGPGFWIPADPSIWILDSNTLDSGFHTKAMDSGFQTIVDSGFLQQKFAGFRIPDSLTWGDHVMFSAYGNLRNETTKQRNNETTKQKLVIWCKA